MPARGGLGVVGAGLEGVGHGVLGACVGLADGGGWVFSGRLSVGDCGWLVDHCVGGVVLVPGVGLAELVVAAGERVGFSVVEELAFEAPLVVLGGVRVQVRLVPLEVGVDGVRRCEVKVFGCVDGGGVGGWVLHASGVVVAGGVVEPVWSWAGEVWPPVGGVVSGWYEDLAGVGYEYGPAFRGLRGLWRVGGDLLGEVELGEGLGAEGFVLHPALWDAALHVLAPELVAGGVVRVPFVVSGVRVWASGARRLRVRACVVEEGVYSVQLADVDGRPVAEVERLVMRPLDAGGLGGRRRLEGLHTVSWLPAAVPVVEADGMGGVWWVLDPVGAGVGVGEVVARGAGVRVERVGDVGGVRERLADPAVVVPDLVVVAVHDAADGLFQAVDGLGEVPSRVRWVMGEVLTVIQEWLGVRDEDARLDGVRLAVLTRGAIEARVGEGVTDLVAAGVWGLVRSAQSEHPGSFVLLDHDVFPEGEGASDGLTGPRSTDALQAVLTTDEPQLALRNNTLTTPRLTQAGPDDVEDGSIEPLQFTRDGTGVVVVSGGTGLLGGLVARRLVEVWGVGCVV
ncbi:polyketide synthase dehydratase domain-containing protein, partial [Streptomyces sp. NPDC059131]|uniref:polyketide synthase dehydratase domain-containing protein n=1 Tax=Streptomyces sp. NPDC059131 TaxID=3346736 RepID=UPI0036B24B78